MPVPFPPCGLESARLHLRPLLASDECPQYFETLNDSTYMRFSRQSLASHNSESARRYAAEIREHGGELLGAFASPGLQLVGTVGVRSVTEPASRVSALALGLLVLRPYAGVGFGREAWNSVVAHLTKERFVGELHAGTHARNFAMQRIIVESGFREILQETPSELPSGSLRLYRLRMR